MNTFEIGRILNKLVGRLCFTDVSDSVSSSGYSIATVEEQGTNAGTCVMLCVFLLAVIAAVVTFIIVKRRGALNGILRITDESGTVVYSEYILMPNNTNYGKTIALSACVKEGERDFGSITVSARRNGTACKVYTVKGSKKIKAGETEVISVSESELFSFTYDVNF